MTWNIHLKCMLIQNYSEEYHQNTVSRKLLNIINQTYKLQQRGGFINHPNKRFIKWFDINLEVYFFFYWLTLDLQKYKPNKGFHGNRKDCCPVESREPVRKFIWCPQSGWWEFCLLNVCNIYFLTFLDFSFPV